MALLWDGSYLQISGINFRSLPELEISLPFRSILNQGTIEIDNYVYPAAWIRTSKASKAELGALIDQWGQYWKLPTLGTHLYQRTKNKIYLIYCLPQHNNQFFPLRNITNHIPMYNLIQAVLLQAEVWGISKINLNNILIAVTAPNVCQLCMIGVDGLLDKNFVNWTAAALPQTIFNQYLPNRTLLRLIKEEYPDEPEDLPTSEELENILTRINPDRTDLPYFFKARWTHFIELIGFEVFT